MHQRHNLHSTAVTVLHTLYGRARSSRKRCTCTLRTTVVLRYVTCDALFQSWSGERTTVRTAGTCIRCCTHLTEVSMHYSRQPLIGGIWARCGNTRGRSAQGPDVIVSIVVGSVQIMPIIIRCHIQSEKLVNTRVVSTVCEERDDRRGGLVGRRCTQHRPGKCEQATRKARSRMVKGMEVFASSCLELRGRHDEKRRLGFGGGSVLEMQGSHY